MSRRAWVSDYTGPCSCGQMTCDDGARLWHAVRVGACQGLLLFGLVKIAQVIFG